MKGAGILIYCIETDRFLLNLRSENVSEGMTYGLFGGKLKINESPEKAALREVKEESSIKINRLIKSTVYKKGNFIYYNYIGIINKEEIPLMNWESKSYKWISEEALRELNNLHYGVKYLINSSIFKNQMKKIRNS